MRVLITRAEPAASRTAHKLRQANHEPIVFPLFDLFDTGTEFPESGARSIVFTSSNAVEILKRRGWRPTPELQTAWCVGKQTAIMAEELGFQSIKTAYGGGKNLTKKILASDNISGTILYPTTPDRSYDLASELHLHGIEVRQIEIYETRKVIPSPSQLGEKLKMCEGGGIFIYSARSGQHFLECLDLVPGKTLTERIGIIGISKTVTSMFQVTKWAAVLASEKPEEDSMIAKLDEIQRA